MKKSVLFLMGLVGVSLLFLLYPESQRENKENEQNEAVITKPSPTKIDPDLLKSEALEAYAKDDIKSIINIVKLFEQHHPTSAQYADVKVLLKMWEERTEQARIAEEKKFKFDICGIQLNMSRAQYGTLINRLRSKGTLSLYQDNLYSMFWFRSNQEFDIKSFGAKSAYSQTFQSPIEYSVLLDKTPEFVNNSLSSIEFLVYSLYEDGAIAGNTKNKDIISTYLSSVFGKEPISDGDWLVWTKNNQSVALDKRRIRDFGGLSYYRLKLTR